MELTANLWGLSFLKMRRERFRNPSQPYAQCQDHGEKNKMCQDITAHELYRRASIVFIKQNRPQVFVPHPIQFLLAYINHKVKSDTYLEPTPPGARSPEGTRWLLWGQGEMEF